MTQKEYEQKKRECWAEFWKNDKQFMYENK